jgi:hypothetical protein
MEETINWISADSKPDSDTTVLCCSEDDIFCGWWDSEVWRDETAMPCVVEFWANVQGPSLRG